MGGRFIDEDMEGEMETAARQSSVDRLMEPSHTMVDISYTAHLAIAILDHAEQHLRNRYNGIYIPGRDPGDWQGMQTLAGARTDLCAVMEYLDGIAEVSK